MLSIAFFVILGVVAMLSVIMMIVVMLCQSAVIIGDHGSYHWQKQLREFMKNSH
jgi:hypothetical protein